MLKIWKSDLYRLRKSKLIYGISAFTCVIAFALTMTIRQDLRLGISVFGNLTAFKNIDDIIRIGVQYHKGLGILIAVIISVFISQEYLWKTWQHKWITSKSRVKIYFSKTILSMGISALIFLLFEVVILLCSGQISEVFTSGYVSMLICGMFVYSALGAVLCMISMLIQNNIMSVITCLGYVLLSETFATLIKNISSFSDSIDTIGNRFITHSIYGMSLRLCGTITTENIIFFAINSAVIILLYTAIGLLFFRKYEL
jgi:ABC-type transport system involved in multi-copper enzyme maturation permease subunit